ncbi:MAG: ASCH domain-containing protein [Nanoarchaeota archaeon]|nr:ASCH domain-containing protein [Nanoarchaeota archaeon]
MHLNKDPFDRVKKGLKKIEGRLNDSKRQRINVGDEIIFVSREDNEELKTVVTDLKKFENFEEMFDKTDITLWATKAVKKEEFVNSFPYYASEEIKENGVLAIYFKLK